MGRRPPTARLFRAGGSGSVVEDLDERLPGRTARRFHAEERRERGREVVEQDRPVLASRPDPRAHEHERDVRVVRERRAVGGPRGPGHPVGLEEHVDVARALAVEREEDAAAPGVGGDAALEELAPGVGAPHGGDASAPAAVTRSTAAGSRPRSAISERLR